MGGLKSQRVQITIKPEPKGPVFPRDQAPEWTCPILNMGECLLITRENGRSQAWQVTNQHLRLAACEKGPRRRHRRRTFPAVDDNSKKTRLICDQRPRHTVKAYRRSRNTVQRCHLWHVRMRWEDNRSRQALKSKLVSRQQDTPVDRSGSRFDMRILEYRWSSTHHLQVGWLHRSLINSLLVGRRLK